MMWKKSIIYLNETIYSVELDCDRLCVRTSFYWKPFDAGSIIYFNRSEWYSINHTQEFRIVVSLRIRFSGNDKNEITCVVIDMYAICVSYSRERPKVRSLNFHLAGQTGLRELFVKRQTLLRPAVHTATAKALTFSMCLKYIYSRVKIVYTLHLPTVVRMPRHIL